MIKNNTKEKENKKLIYMTVCQEILGNVRDKSRSNPDELLLRRIEVFKFTAFFSGQTFPTVSNRFFMKVLEYQMHTKICSQTTYHSLLS